MQDTLVKNTNGPAVRAAGDFYEENCTFIGSIHAFNASHGPAFFNSCKFESPKAGVQYSRQVTGYNCSYSGNDKLFDNNKARTVNSKIAFPKLNFE